MKFLLSLTLLAGFFFASCSDMDEPPQRVRHRVAKYPEQGQAQAGPTQQPFNPNAPASPEGTPPPQLDTTAAPSASPAHVAKGDLPYGIPLPGKPGYVTSPYVPGSIIDVRGMAPGTEVKDPYTDFKKIFRVP
jgi:hypothetical protein